MNDKSPVKLGLNAQVPENGVQFFVFSPGQIRPESITTPAFVPTTRQLRCCLYNVRRRPS